MIDSAHKCTYLLEEGSNKAGERLVAWKAGDQWRYEPFVDDVTGLIVGAEYNGQIHSWWYEEIARIDPAQRNSDPPCAYISVVNELSQQLFSLLTVCIRLSQRLLALEQQWYTTARPHSTLFPDFEHSHLQRSGKS